MAVAVRHWPNMSLFATASFLLNCLSFTYATETYYLYSSLVASERIMRAVVALRPLVLLLFSANHRSSTKLTLSCIEVKRKFEPPADLAALNAAVLKAGGTRLDSTSFTGVYYDCLLEALDLSLDRIHRDVRP